jgi:hypothetical protein
MEESHTVYPRSDVVEEAFETRRNRVERSRSDGSTTNAGSLTYASLESEVCDPHTIRIVTEMC